MDRVVYNREYLAALLEKDTKLKNIQNKRLLVLT